MDRRIILSADSTCDLGEELKKQYQVHFYPFHIILDGRDYQDNVDIHPQDIYRVWREKKLLPKTAAINVAEYIDYFRKWVEEGYEVIHLNLGSALSSAHQNCVLAAQEVGGVYPVDACNLSTGIGLLVIKAAEMIEKGMAAGEISQQLKAMTGMVHASFILDTLEFMRAGGHCSAVVAFGANALGLKPCIEVDNRSGAMHVGKKYRGGLEHVLVKYTRDQLTRYPNIDTRHIFITHSGIDQGLIDLVKETIGQVMDFDEIHITKASFTISYHCGPNTLGVLFMTL